MVFKFNTAKAIQYANNYLKNNNSFFKKFEGFEEEVSFVSQCILAGSENQMCKEENGWFYNNETSYSLSWINDEMLFEFLLKTNCGPFGRLTNISNLAVGDVIFLNKEGKQKSVGIVTKSIDEDFFIAIKSKKKEFLLNDLKDFEKRFLHLIGVKK